MKRQSILGAVTALGIISSSIASTTLMSTTAALADDWSNSNDRPAWSQRCDRNWDNAYCNPRANPNGNQKWIGPDRSRNQDSWNPDQEQWQTRNQDQWDRQHRSLSTRLSEGTYIPAYLERSGRRIVLQRSERYPLTLVVSQDVGQSSRRGRVALPRNSRIEGELVPTRGGYRFEASRVRFPNGQQSRISAVSNVIRQNDGYDPYNRNESRRSSETGSILGAIFGRSNSDDSTIRGDIYNRYPNDRQDLVVISPDQSLDLRLTRDFVMDWRNF